MVSGSLGFVYKWVNNINGKWYTGSHDGSNPKYTASGKLIKQAFKKYGMDNFTRYILYTGDDFRLIEELSLISHDAMNDPTSYNLTNVAHSWDHIPSTKGIPKSAETRRKMSEANRGRKRPDLVAINKLRKGIKNPNCGNGKRKETVVKGIIYRSLIEAAKSLNMDRSTLSWQLKHNRI